jgi:hypothetical protein
VAEAPDVFYHPEWCLLEDGYDIQTIQELLGTAMSSATMTPASSIVAAGACAIHLIAD